MQPSKAVLILSGFLTAYSVSVQENISGFIFRSYLLNFSLGTCVSLVDIHLSQVCEK